VVSKSRFRKGEGRGTRSVNLLLQVGAGVYVEETLSAGGSNHIRTLEDLWTPVLVLLFLCYLWDKWWGLYSCCQARCRHRVGTEWLFLEGVKEWDYSKLFTCFPPELICFFLGMSAIRFWGHITQLNETGVKEFLFSVCSEILNGYL
jgi:hypothetical protein